MYKNNGEKDESKHPRLYVDMDGTLAEWRQFYVEIAQEEDGASAVMDKINRVLYTPGYFKTLRPHKNVVDAVNALVERGDVDVYVMSCVLPDVPGSSPVTEKNEWIDTYLPGIDKDHRIFVPDGDDKSAYIVSCNDGSSNVLLDDYTKNCEDFSRIGTSVKLLNNVNEGRGSWKGAAISYDSASEVIERDLCSVIFENASVRHPSPAKGGETYSADVFIRGVEDLSER